MRTINPRSRPRGLLFLVTLLLSVWPLPSHAQGGPPRLDPVIVTGQKANRLLGVRTDEIVVFVYRNRQWQMIPYQVDEVDENGVYRGYENGVFDINDEVVFMPQDAAAAGPEQVPTGVLLGNAWYAVQVAPPQAPGAVHWAYIVHSVHPLAPSPVDYVDFLVGYHRIRSDAYTLGLGATYPGADYLRLGANGPEILDRMKLESPCDKPIGCPITDETQLPIADHLVKDGPVRVILRDGKLKAYEAMVDWQTDYNLPEASTVRYSFDFNQGVSGSTLYTLLTPKGVTVDGRPEPMLAKPFSPWWQLSTANGSVVHIARASTLGRDVSTYYVDNALYDETDTGDRRHYGDIGLEIATPFPNRPYSFVLYFLQDKQPNVGAEYADQLAASQVITVTLAGQGADTTSRTFLPAINR